MQTNIVLGVHSDTSTIRYPTKPPFTISKKHGIISPVNLA